MLNILHLTIPQIVQVKVHEGLLYAYDETGKLLFSTDDPSVMQTYLDLPAQIYAMAEHVNEIIAQANKTIESLTKLNHRLLLEGLPNGGYKGISH